MRVRQNALWIMLIILLTSVFTVGTVASSPSTQVCAPTIIDKTLVPLKNFDANITIVDVTDLYSWDVVLSFNPAVLEATAVSMPDPNFLGLNTTWAIGIVQPVIDNFMGTVKVGDTFYPPPPPPEGVSGNGTLAIITFEVKAENAISPLALEHTALEKIVNGTNVPIPHETINGLFDNRMTLLPPVALFYVEPLVTYVSEKITFNASESYDPDGDIVRYRWDFGDGTVVNLTDPVATHVYNSTGTYTVGLNVTDNNDLTDTATYTVVVGKQNSTITISASPTTIKVGENTTISGSITPTRQGVTVTIRYRKTGGEWSTLTTVTTDTSGQYSYVWTPETAGAYEVKASWNGDENTLPDESDPQTIVAQEAPSPTPPPGPGIPPNIIAVAVVAIAIVAAGIAVYFLKTRKANASRTQPRILCSRFFLSSEGNKTCEGPAENEKSLNVM